MDIIDHMMPVALLTADAELSIYEVADALEEYGNDLVKGRSLSGGRNG